MAMHKRIKQLIQLLTCILLLDGIFLLYKYRQIYHGHGHSVSLGSNSLDELPVRYPKDIFKKYRKQDVVMSLKQTRAILNPNDLQAAQSQIRYNQNAVQSVLLLKTHKTGSSTVQNILLRYGILRNLTVALPAYKASFFWPLSFNAKEFVMQQDGISSYNILAHHSKFNEIEMKKIMEPKAIFMTILREPVSLFRSAYTYYNMERPTCFNTSIDDFTSSPYYDKIKSTGKCGTGLPVKNLQAFDLGLSMTSMDNKQVELLIENIDRVMDMVIITERFDESLVLLRKKLNWRIEDVVYFRQNAQKEYKSRNSPRSVAVDEAILRFNQADSRIYNHFAQRLTQELDKAFTKSELQSELNSLHSMQELYMNQCVLETAPATSLYFRDIASGGVYFRPYGANTMGYILRDTSRHDVNCRLLAMPELSLTHYLKGVAAHASH